MPRSSTGASTERPSETDRAKLTNGAHKNTVSTTCNTGVYAAGSGIESDLQDLMKEWKDE